MIRKATAAPFDSKPASIIGPDTEPVRVVALDDVVKALRAKARAWSAYERTPDDEAADFIAREFSSQGSAGEGSRGA